jgi:hypothetical protein
MHWNQHLKVPKKEKQVTLWIHPEGRVVGSLFLSLQNRYSSGEEEPLEALNDAEPFLVFKREDTNERRFYNKASIMRVEYREENQPSLDGMGPLQCRLYLMDGSVVEGAVNRALPPDHSRLYDYLNMDTERFTQIYTEDGVVCLINKACVVSVAALVEKKPDENEWQTDGFAERIPLA